MSLFTDSTGHEWRVEITLGSLGRLKREADFDLSAMSEGERLLSCLLGDPIKVADVIWLVCQKQANGTSRDVFDDAFDGPTFGRAQMALAEAVIDFFHPGQAAEIKASLPGLMEQVRETLKVKIDSTSNGSGGSSPASSASMPES